MLTYVPECQWQCKTAWFVSNKKQGHESDATGEGMYTPRFCLFDAALGAGIGILATMHQSSCALFDAALGAGSGILAAMHQSSCAFWLIARNTNDQRTPKYQDIYIHGVQKHILGGNE